MAKIEIPFVMPGPETITHSAAVVASTVQVYDHGGSAVSYSTIARGTFYDQSPEIRASLDRFNSGTLYGIKMIGNRLPGSAKRWRPQNQEV